MSKGMPEVDGKPLPRWLRERDTWQPPVDDWGEDAGWFRRAVCALRGHKRREVDEFVSHEGGGYFTEVRIRCECGRGWWL